MQNLLELERNNIEHLLGVRAYVLDHQPFDVRSCLAVQNRAFSNLEFLEQRVAHIQPGDLYHLTDPFNCQFLVLRLDDCLLFCGPYLNEIPERSQIHQLLAANHLAYSQQLALSTYLSFVPVCEDLPVFSALQLLFRAVEGPAAQLNYQHFRHLPAETAQLPYSPREGHAANMTLIEKSYELEDKMLLAVARGNSSEALERLAELMRTGARHIRSGERLRDERNLCFVLGALLRKTAQQTGVHPVYLDAASSDFARQIEQCRTTQEVDRLRIRMVKSYCELVDRLHNESYSMPVRKALNYIHLNLSASLPVEAIAQAIECSPHYLSTLFNRELKQSITEYIHSQRLREAAELLRKTNLTIQSIAVYVGYTDTNYFSRLFRRHYQSTPSEYRKTIRPATL